MERRYTNYLYFLMRNKNTEKHELTNPIFTVRDIFCAFTSETELFNHL